VFRYAKISGAMAMFLGFFGENDRRPYGKRGESRAQNRRGRYAATEKQNAWIVPCHKKASGEPEAFLWAARTLGERARWD